MAKLYFSRCIVTSLVMLVLSISALPEELCSAGYVCTSTDPRTDKCDFCSPILEKSDIGLIPGSGRIDNLSPDPRCNLGNPFARRICGCLEVYNAGVFGSLGYDCWIQLNITGWLPQWFSETRPCTEGTTDYIDCNRPSEPWTTTLIRQIRREGFETCVSVSSNSCAIGEGMFPTGQVPV